MGIIGPNMTPKEVRDSAVKTYKGDGLKAALPGVAADAHSMDKAAFSKNRELAKKIQDLLAEYKPSDKGVPRFVIVWRIFPNAANPVVSGGGPDACGCGCSCGG